MGIEIIFQLFLATFLALLILAGFEILEEKFFKNE